MELDIPQGAAWWFAKHKVTGRVPQCPDGDGQTWPRRQPLTIGWPASTMVVYV